LRQGVGKGLAKGSGNEKFATIESYNGLAWKGLERPSSSNPAAMGRDTFH